MAGVAPLFKLAVRRVRTDVAPLFRLAVRRVRTGDPVPLNASGRGRPPVSYVSIIFLVFVGGFFLRWILVGILLVLVLTPDDDGAIHRGLLGSRFLGDTPSRIWGLWWCAP